MSTNLKWKVMACCRPQDCTNILWRIPGKPGMGVGYYMKSDRQEWDLKTEWLSFDDLNKLGVQE